MPRSSLRINAQRLQNQLTALAQIGAIDGGGVCRLAFSAEDKAGRDFIETQMRALGLDVRIDAIGNILGIRRGRKDGPIVLTGSHTDTVATGGKYDGSLGVLTGLEVVNTLNDAGVETDLPLGVISFVNEEGVRFMPDMMGSLFLRGDLSVEKVRAFTGIDGTSIGENLDQTSYAGHDDLRSLSFASFVELHIEQGPVLEAEKLDIGIVERVQGISWTETRFTGTANHAGATPMSMRRDAGLAAARLAVEVHALTKSDSQLRATVGSMRLTPNLINVIAQNAVVTVDLRHPDAGGLQEAETRLDKVVADIVEETGVAVEQSRLARVAPEAFDAGCIEAISNAVETLGYTSKRMISGAAHDAQILSVVMPAAMIFVPSRGGVSHNVTEHTEPEHIESGANVLLLALMSLVSDL